MSKKTSSPESPLVELRVRAQTRLDGGASVQGSATSAASAHRVLHDLALSPRTAADALALLHELQVHQVELDLQAEDLRLASAELESALDRRIQLHEHAPVGLLIIDGQTAVIEVNLAGVQQLGRPREAILGQRLDQLLPQETAAALLALLSGVGPDGHASRTILELPGQSGAPRRLHASATADPVGGQFLLALTDLISGA
jgi:PAS domain-containing protein